MLTLPARGDQWESRARRSGRASDILCAIGPPTWRPRSRTDEAALRDEINRLLAANEAPALCKEEGERERDDAAH